MAVFRCDLSVVQTRAIIEAVGHPCHCDADTLRQEINEIARLCSWPSTTLAHASAALGDILEKAEALRKSHENYERLRFLFPGTTLGEELRDSLLPSKLLFHQTPDWLKALAPGAPTLGDNLERWLQQIAREKQKIDRLIIDRKRKRQPDTSWFAFVRGLCRLFRDRFNLEPTTTQEAATSVFLSEVLIGCGHPLTPSGARSRLLKMRKALKLRLNSGRH